MPESPANPPLQLAVVTHLKGKLLKNGALSEQLQFDCPKTRQNVFLRYQYKGFAGITFAFRVHLGGNDPLVFLKRDGTLFLELHFRPLVLRQD